MLLFKNLSAIKDFNHSFDPRSFVDVPADHFVIITDVVGSTKAIEAGRYKEVNISGGLSVIALANAFKDMEFPFVFGGDGVTFVVGPEKIRTIEDVLADTRAKVKFMYDLDLRIGVVPISLLQKENSKVAIAKLRISDHYSQAILQGEGVDYAEKLVKQPGSIYLITGKHDPKIEADFTGFTCRWQDIQSHQGETLALIVKARENQSGNSEKVYADTVKKIIDLIGNEEEHHPVQSSNLKTGGFRQAINEAMAMSQKKGYFKNILKLLRIRFETFMTNIFMKFQISKKYGHYDLKDLKRFNQISSDYKKFDGTLKMVVSLTKETREKLLQFLEAEYQKGNIFYGTHISDRALMTCMLHSDSAREVHFVDAADGGYALAAKQLKEQIKKQNLAA